MKARRGSTRTDPDRARARASATTRSSSAPARATRLGGTLVALAALGTPGTPHASICDLHSPSFAIVGDDGRPSGRLGPASIDAPAPPAPMLDDRADPRRAKVLRLHQLQERLHDGVPSSGGGLRTRCVGRDERRREIGWRFELEQLERVATADGRTRLTAFESRHTVTGEANERRTAGTLVAETIDLPARADWKTSADLSSLRAHRRVRRAGAVSESCALVRRPASFTAALLADADRLAASCSYVTEIDTTARLVDGAVELEQVFYVGGLGSERVVWRIEP